MSLITVRTAAGGGGGGGSTITKVSTEDGSIPEAIDGVEQNFTIGATPTIATSLVFLGVTKQTTGFTFAAGEIQFSSAPTLGMGPLTVIYWS